MKVPVQLEIGGYPIKIVYENELRDSEGCEIAGQYASMSHVIQISKSRNNSAAKLFSTLFHEAQHVSLEICGHAEFLGEKKEEAVVYGIESMLAPLLIFNPKSTKIKWKKIDFPW